jgi:gliding motility-associated-like protein
MNVFPFIYRGNFMTKALYLFLLSFYINSVLLAQVNFSNGLMAYYPFKGNFNDASGKGNHGTGNNGVTFGPDQWGNPNEAAFFDGINDWVSIAASPTLTPGKKTTIAFRFKSNSNALQVLLAKSDFIGGSAPNNFQYQVGINGAGVLPNNGLFFSSSHTNTCVLNTALATNYGYGELTSANNWYCVVITFDSGVKKIYMNGVLTTTSTITGTVNNASIDTCSGGTLRLGVWWQKDTRYFSGYMDELRIWNRAINKQEIDSLCNLITLPPPTDTVINNYAAILDRNLCDNSFAVDTTDGFAIGDTLLMIQMKGASIDTSNSATFGSVLANNGAGNYEYNVVSGISGNRISLKYEVQRTYDIPDGLVQFVRVPSAISYTINKEHTCLPWTGTKGGVFALRVTTALTLNKNINVSGKGFRGGKITGFKGSPRCDQLNYYYSASSHDGGSKGEGIAELSAGRNCGKGKQANGGGGGNSAGSGGGGGSNAGVGGIGGHQSTANGCDTSLASGGINGATLPYTAASNRLYLGGGGGAGHEHSGYSDPGGNGGGIVLIQVGSMAGNGDTIKANGGHCVDKNATKATGTIGDGQGGGGAGGTILIRSNAYSSPTYVEAKGGNGGSVYAQAIHGPGGGGGGGAILFSGPAINPANLSTAAGQNGTVINVGGRAHDAQPGQKGVTVSGMPYSFPTVLFQPNKFSINFSDSMASCLGRLLQIRVSTTSTGVASYEWHYEDKISTLPNPLFRFPGKGVFPIKLIVTDSNGCQDSLIKPLTVDYAPFVIAEKDTIICPGGFAVIRAVGGISYSWSPAGSLDNPLSDVTKARPGETTTYIVVAKDSSGCTDKDSVTIAVRAAPPVDAYSEGDAVSCNNSRVHLHAQGALHYTWSPGMYCNDSTASSPVVTPVRTTLFTLTGIDDWGCTNTDTITVYSAKDAEVFIPTGFTPNGDGRNDAFRPITYCDFELSEFRVFNRWGQCIFFGFSNKHAWDGLQNGKPAELGVYFYFIRGHKISTGEEIIYKGDITLIR